MVKVFPLKAFTDNYIWILIDEKQKVFSCVDPGDAQPVLNFAAEHKLVLHDILLTHHHWDHINGTNDLLKSFPKVNIYGPIDSRIPFVTHPCTEPLQIKLLNLTFEILNIPGHTSTHIAFFEPTKKWLFCGDTLFSAGCGRVFDGSFESLFASLTKLNALDNETNIYCGHEYTRNNLKFALEVEPNNQAMKDYLHLLTKQNLSLTLPSKLKHEKEINPFLRVQTLSDFISLRQQKDKK